MLSPLALLFCKLLLCSVSTGTLWVFV